VTTTVEGRLHETSPRGMDVDRTPRGTFDHHRHEPTRSTSASRTRAASRDMASVRGATSTVLFQKLDVVVVGAATRDGGKSLL